MAKIWLNQYVYDFVLGEQLGQNKEDFSTYLQNRGFEACSMFICACDKM